MAPVTNATLFAIFDTSYTTKKTFAGRRRAASRSLRPAGGSVHVLTTVDGYVGAGYKRRFFG
jgi:hypothetical protein